MRKKLRLALSVVVVITAGVSVARAADEQKETLGDKLKKLFVRPTPTPKPRKKRKTSPTPGAAASKTPSPSAVETPASSSPEASATSSQAEETPTATATERSGTQYFDAVRPISPPPRSRPGATPRIIRAPQTPMPSATVIPESAPEENPESRPEPSLPSINSPAESPINKAAPSATATRTPSPSATKVEIPKPTISIAESGTYSPGIRKIVDLGLDLTARNLSYKYASADPARGGMDCSGFIFYVLTQSGVKDVPRDAREQYVWVRKAGNFQAVLAQRDDTFELDGLKPGDLLFWSSNFGVSREPEISQTMIYLGREKGTNQRIMMGASEGGSYKDKRRAGVGVFDFKVGRAAPKSSKEETGPVFVGYGRIPGLSEK